MSTIWGSIFTFFLLLIFFGLCFFFLAILSQKKSNKKNQKNFNNCSELSQYQSFSHNLFSFTSDKNYISDVKIEPQKQSEIKKRNTSSTIIEKKCKFLGEGEYNICGHKLFNPFIYVAFKCTSADDEYAVNLNHSENLIMKSEKPDEMILDIENSSFDKANLFFFKPEQTHYFLTWLEKYYSMSVLPKHCFSRWMGGLYKRAIIDQMDTVIICKKMLKFTLRYCCSYYDYDMRMNIIQFITAIAGNIDTNKLSSDDKNEFRVLLDRVIEPLAFYYFKPGWRWDPAYLYDKLTGSPQMTLFKSCLVWLAKHDDTRFDYWVMHDGEGYNEHGLDQFSALLFAMMKVCDAIKNHTQLTYQPQQLKRVFIEKDPMLLDFATLKYSYIEYNYGNPFSNDELMNNVKQFFDFASQGRYVAKLFHSNDWNIADIDGVARNFFDLPPFFKEKYGYLIDSYIKSKEEEFIRKNKNKLQTRNTLIYSHGFDYYGKNIEDIFNKKKKYKLWAENGPKWNSPSSFSCISDKQVGDMILLEDAKHLYKTNTPIKKKSLKYDTLHARNLTDSQEKILNNTNNFYDESLIEPLCIMAMKTKMIPPVFEVRSKTLQPNNNLKENQLYFYGCWDNAVNKALILDKDAYTRVFICAKWSTNETEYKVVWDNVRPIKDQQLTVTGIHRQLKKIPQTELFEPQYPFSQEYTIDNGLVKIYSELDNSI